MFVSRGYLLLSILAAVSAAPRRHTRSNLPMWHLPCGEELEMDDYLDTNIEQETSNSIQNLRLQHELTINDYLSRDYEYLYENVRIGVEEYQYIPNWVPGEKDTHMIKNLANTNSQTVSLISHILGLFFFVFSFRLSNRPYNVSGSILQ